MFVLFLIKQRLSTFEGEEEKKKVGGIKIYTEVGYSNNNQLGIYTK